MVSIRVIRTAHGLSMPGLQEMQLLGIEGMSGLD